MKRTRKTGGWCEFEKASLKRFFEQGKTDTELAELFDCTRLAIQNVRQKMGLLHKTTMPWSEEEKNTLIEMVNAGKSDKEIGLVVGRSSDSVGAQRRHTMNLRYREHEFERWTTVEEQALRELHYEGFTAREIGERLERTISAVRYRRAKLKLKQVTKDSSGFMSTVEKMRSEGLQWIDIADELGYAYPYVCNKYYILKRKAA